MRMGRWRGDDGLGGALLAWSMLDGVLMMTPQRALGHRQRFRNILMIVECFMIVEWRRRRLVEEREEGEVIAPVGFDDKRLIAKRWCDHMRDSRRLLVADGCDDVARNHAHTRAGQRRRGRCVDGCAASVSERRAGPSGIP
jgi:hypothetical protein